MPAAKVANPPWRKPANKPAQNFETEKLRSLAGVFCVWGGAAISSSAESCGPRLVGAARAKAVIEEEAPRAFVHAARKVLL